MYSLPIQRLKAILSHVVTGATLVSVDDMKTTQLARLYTLNMSDGTKHLLSFAPRLTTRLLRHEATIISSEATLVHFIAGSRARQEAESSSRTKETFPGLPAITELIPTLLKHSSNNREMAYPYSIFEPTAGAPLSTLSIYLSLPVRRAIDTKIGLMARSLANLTAPSGTFGLISRVLPDPFPTHPIQDLGSASTAATSSARSVGSKTWSEAFNTLLEMVLRDGEDMAVLLPYDDIRAHFKRLRWRLDAITIPRLAILDLGSETNVMIEREPDGASPSTAATDVKVTGLRSWSHGVFGDPLIASCFDEASEGFLEGWRMGGEGKEEVVEDEENAGGRMLLYACYRAVVGIVTEYYRPQGDSSRRELEERRRLTNVLKELEGLDITTGEVGKRARTRSASSEGEEAKRQRVGSRGETG